MEIPQLEKYKVTGPMKMVIKACLQLMKTMGHKDIHLSFGGHVSTDTDTDTKSVHCALCIVHRIQCIKFGSLTISISITDITHQ